jgi:hypothetical protein
VSGDEAVTCASCGTVAADGPPLDWTTQVSERGRGLEYVCDRCSREHVRAIEARLSPEWW